jgi:hypothetical protein
MTLQETEGKQEDKMETRDKSLRILCLIESTILLAIALFAIGRMLCNSMSTKLEPSTYIHITQYPDKLTYVIGKDTELDFTGGMVNISTSPDRYEGNDIDMQENMGGLLKNISDEIDLMKEGVYLVRIEGLDSSCGFPIQVISPDYVE